MVEDPVVRRGGDEEVEDEAEEPGDQLAANLWEGLYYMGIHTK